MKINNLCRYLYQFLPRKWPWEAHGKQAPDLFRHARVGEAFSFLVGAGGRHAELRLRARDRRTLTLDRKAVLLEIAGGEVAADAGQDFGHAPGRRGSIKHRPIHPVV
jgi:hypothetical protein